MLKSDAKIQASQPQTTKSGHESAEPKPKPTRNAEIAAHKANLGQKTRNLRRKKRNRAQIRANHNKRPRRDLTTGGALDRSKHTQDRAEGPDTKSKLPEGLKCKNERRKKIERREEKSRRGRAPIYSPGKVRCDSATGDRFLPLGPRIPGILHTDRNQSWFLFWCESGFGDFETMDSESETICRGV